MYFLLFSFRETKASLFLFSVEGISPSLASVCLNENNTASQIFQNDNNVRKSVAYGAKSRTTSRQSQAR